jgi:hypothetical protein
MKVDKRKTLVHNMEEVQIMPEKSRSTARSTQTAKTPQNPEMPKNVYSREFKLETRRLLESHARPRQVWDWSWDFIPGQIGLREKALNEEEGNVERAFPGTRLPGPGHQSHAEAEVSRLKREREIVRQKRDILKATACGSFPVFSRTQDPD